MPRRIRLGLALLAVLLVGCTGAMSTSAPGTADASTSAIATAQATSLAQSTAAPTAVPSGPAWTPAQPATPTHGAAPTPTDPQDPGTDPVPDPPLEVSLTTSKTAVRPGDLVRVNAKVTSAASGKVASGVACVLTMSYQFSEEVDIGSKVTNTKGVATWRWVVDPDPQSDTMFVTVDCGDRESWGLAQVDIPIDRVAIACREPVPSGRVSIDGVLAPGEWDDAAAFGPVAVELGGDAIATTVYVRPGADDLLIGVRFDRDLSSLAVHTVSVHLDSAPMDGEWNAGGAGNGDDGLVMNLLRDWFFDVHFSTAVVPNQGQGDDQHGGTVDGSMAVDYDGSTTVVEMSHPFRSGDIRDAALAGGETFGLSVSSYLEDADGDETFANLVPWHASGAMQWVACDVPGE